jgi:type II secretory pathway component GspD/PulD (secretin)
VHGAVTLSLNDATPDEALQAVCTQARLRCVRDGRTVVVSAQSSAVVPLTLVPAARAERVLRGLFPRLSVAEGGSGNTLVLEGPDGDIQAARAVVQGLDVRDPTKASTEAITLRSQPAALVADRLRPLYPSAKITLVGRSTMLVSAPPGDLAQIKATVAGIDAASPQATIAPVMSDAVKVLQRRPADIALGVSSQLTHVRVGVSGPTITLSGPPEDVQRAKALIAQLDVPPFGTRYTQIYRLKNVDAESVAGLIRRAFPQADVSVDASLNAISVTASATDQQRIADGVAQLDGTSVPGQNRGGGGDEGGAPVSVSTSHEIVQLRSIVPGISGQNSLPSAQDIGTAVQQALQQGHPELRVTVPNGMQSLILTGSAQSVREAKELALALDVIPQSVVLDTEILELDENSSRNLGLQLGTTSVGSTFSEILPTPSPNGIPGRLIGVHPFTRTSISFQASVNLLLQNGRARVLADPRITTLSGRTATIRAGDHHECRRTQRRAPPDRQLADRVSQRRPADLDPRHPDDGAPPRQRDVGDRRPHPRKHAAQRQQDPAVGRYPAGRTRVPQREHDQHPQRADHRRHAAPARQRQHRHPERRADARHRDTHPARVADPPAECGLPRAGADARSRDAGPAIDHQREIRRTAGRPHDRPVAEPAAERVRAREHVRVRVAAAEQLCRTGRRAADLLCDADADGVLAEFDGAHQRDHVDQRAAPHDRHRHEFDLAFPGRVRNVAGRLLRQRARAAAGGDVAAPHARRLTQRRSNREHPDHGIDPAHSERRRNAVAGR